MSTRTDYYGLVVPALSDTPDITALNENWTTIEHHLKQKMHVETGAYNGSGQYGSSHKTTITFPDYFLPTTVNINGFAAQFYVRWYEYQDLTYDYTVFCDDPDITADLNLTLRPGKTPNYNIYDIKTVELTFYSDSASKQYNTSSTSYDWYSMGR